MINVVELEPHSQRINSSKRRMSRRLARVFVPAEQTQLHLRPRADKQLLTRRSGKRAIISGGSKSASRWTSLHDPLLSKAFEILTDECVSDHNERIRSIQIDKNFITQTFRMHNFIIRRTVRNCSLKLTFLPMIKFLSICIDLILSFWSGTHSSLQNSNIFNHKSAE